MNRWSCASIALSALLLASPAQADSCEGVVIQSALVDPLPLLGRDLQTQVGALADKRRQNSMSLPVMPQCTDQFLFANVEGHGTVAIRRRLVRTNEMVNRCGDGPVVADAGTNTAAGHVAFKNCAR